MLSVNTGLEHCRFGILDPGQHVSVVESARFVLKSKEDAKELVSTEMLYTNLHLLGILDSRILALVRDNIPIQDFQIRVAARRRGHAGTLVVLLGLVTAHLHHWEKRGLDEEDEYLEIPKTQDKCHPQ